MAGVQATQRGSAVHSGDGDGSAELLRRVARLLWKRA